MVIVTVRESKLKAQDTARDSESTHLKSSIETGTLFKPTSNKATMARHVVISTEVHVINCAPLTPTTLPKKPDTIEPIMGSAIIAKYIIYTLLICFLLDGKTLPRFLSQ